MTENMSRIFDFMIRESEIPMAIDGHPLEHWDKLLLCDKKDMGNIIQIRIRDEKEFTNTEKKLTHTLFSY